MIITKLFFQILGLGAALPCTLVVLVNLYLFMWHGPKYELHLDKFLVYYSIALVGWATVFGIK